MVRAKDNIRKWAKACFDMNILNDFGKPSNALNFGNVTIAPILK